MGASWRGMISGRRRKQNGVPEMLIQSTPLTILRPGSPPLRFDALDVKAGDRLLLCGPSGSGKTTLLSALAGLLKPSHGSVRLLGQEMYAMPDRDRDILRGRNFGFVFQTLHLLPYLTLRQNVELAGTLVGKADDRRVDQILSTLGLIEKAHRKPHALSRGEQQRAAIARAVLNKPSVIIADEPTSSLDDHNAAKVIDLLEIQAAENNAALLIATHDNRIRDRFDNVVTLNAGADRT